MASRNGKYLEPPLSRKFARSAFVTALLMSLVAMGFTSRLRGQAPPAQTSAVVEAARNARALSSGRHSKIITNADLGVQFSVPSAATCDLQLSSTASAEVPSVLPAGCDNPQAERLRTELQATQQELDQLRHDLQYNPPVVSGNDLDLQYFKPGNSGFDVGAPPLLDTQPPIPARVTEVELEQRIARLQKAVRLACEPPEAARIQSAIDDLEQELDPVQRQFALDQEDYYSRPVTERTGGNSQLDAEQQQIQVLQAQIQNLREQLAALTSAQGPR
jgi:DNA repair exonuclease SbcCD ATPase subunit